MDKKKITWIAVLTAGYVVCCALAFHLGFGAKFPFMGAVLLWSVVVIGFLSYITGAMIVSDDQPDWLRLLAGFFAMMAIGGMFVGLSDGAIDTLRP